MTKIIQNEQTKKSPNTKLWDFIRLEQPNKKPFKRFFPETNKKQFLPEMIRVRLFHHIRYMQ